MQRAVVFAIALGMLGCADNNARPPGTDVGPFIPFDSGPRDAEPFDGTMPIDSGVPDLFDVGPGQDSGAPLDSGEVTDTGTTPDTSVTPDTGVDSGFDSGPPVSCAGGCNDMNPCTTDTCGPTGTCVFTPADADSDGVPALGCLTGTDCDDTRSSVYPGALEICDGLDNNCDTVVDNGSGFQCRRGMTGLSCVTTCGSVGAQSCTDSCTLTACVATEVCNGCDDDGNGVRDNGFNCVQGTTMACNTNCGSAGTQTCRSDCSGMTSCAATEVCNGCDDDGVGGPDDTFACVAGTTTACMVGSCPGTTTCSGSCTAGSCSIGAAPGNNVCGAGVTTISASGTYSFGTCGATNNYSGSCGGSTGPDVVFRLNVAARSTVTLETTAATTFDSVLHLRSGNSCPGTEVACNDDFTGGGSRSRITSTLDAGTYWIVVDGFTATSTGAGALAVTLTPLTPANDECGGATAIPLNLGRTTVTGSTASATTSSTGCYSGKDVWYSFTLFEPELVYITTFGSTFDTGVGMREASCAGATVACTDDSCSTLQTSFVRALNAGTHYIVVDGVGGAEGSFTLNIEHLPLGNNLTAYGPLPVGSSMANGTTTGTGNQSDCNSGTAPEHSYFWTQCPGDAGGAFEMDTCDPMTVFDTSIYLWSGPTGFSLACNDDDAICGSGRSYISATIPSGAGLFMGYVDGFGSAAGAYRAFFVRP